MSRLSSRTRKAMAKHAIEQGVQSLIMYVEELIGALDEARDVTRLDKLQAVAERKNCGWRLGPGDVPKLVHWSQEPTFKTLREAIDAMPDKGEK